MKLYNYQKEFLESLKWYSEKRKQAEKRGNKLVLSYYGRQWEPRIIEVRKEVKE